MSILDHGCWSVLIDDSLEELGHYSIKYGLNKRIENIRTHVCSRMTPYMQENKHTPMKNVTINASLLYANTEKNVRDTILDVVDPNVYATVCKMDEFCDMALPSS